MPGALSARVERDASIDVARGIAIVLVVLGHNRALSMAWPALVAAIFLFHVPLFFLLSGRVMRPESPLRAAPRLARRLLVPFLLAALLVGAIKCVTRGEPVIGTLWGIAWATGETLPWSHLWFLPTLFLALLATHALALGVNKSVGWTAAAVLAVGAAAVLPMAGSTGWPWGFDLLPLCLSFVWIGQAIHAGAAAQRVAVHPAVVAMAAAVFVLTLGVARVDLNTRVFEPFVPALAAALAGCVLTLWMSRGLCRVSVLARPLALIGRHTLVIFILHVSVQKALLVAYPGESLSQTGLGILGLATAALTIAITLPISVLIDRTSSRLHARQTATPSEAR
jgi:fucose 4-O-acetylase-like acetyltransferase